MNRIFPLEVMAVALVLLPVGCSDGEPENGGRNPFTPVNLSQSSRSVVTAENDFSIDLFRFIATENSQSINQSNFCLSPFSAYASLALLSNGVSAPTKETLQSMLAANNASLTTADISEYISTMAGVLPGLDKHSKCSVDYALWHDAYLKLTFGFKQSLKQIVPGNFKIFNRSPAGEEGMKGINNWVSSATKGEIPEFLEKPLDESINWTLLNACYFKGEWKEKFNPDKSADGLFAGIDGTGSTKIFMHQTKDYSYALRDRVNYLRVPFGNGNFVMNLMLPEATDGYEAMLRNLSASKIQIMKESATVCEVELSLPRFSVDTELDLKSFLENKADDTTQVVMNQMFDSHPTIILFMKQKSRIEVDEKGAVAAAATVTGGFTASAGPLKKVVLNFNRPFIYLIEETSSGTILYMGSLVR